MKIEKSENLKFLDFALVTDEVIKVFNDFITFGTCDEVILITFSLKVKHVKFHWFSMERTGFTVIFLLRAKKSPPPLKYSKKAAWVRVNVMLDDMVDIMFSNKRFT